jgi:hypothetical protein
LTQPWQDMPETEKWWWCAGLVMSKTPDRERFPQIGQGHGLLQERI